jgi:hypothetical protein
MEDDCGVGSSLKVARDHVETTFPPPVVSWRPERSAFVSYAAGQIYSASAAPDYRRNEPQIQSQATLAALLNFLSQTRDTEGDLPPMREQGNSDIRVIRFFLSLFVGPPDVLPVPTKRLGIDLARIDGALLVEKEFPRPQWKVIHAWVKQNIPAEDLPYAWQEISFDWLAKLEAQLGGNYVVDESANFLLLTSKGPDARRSVLKTSELAVQFLVKWLGAIAEKRGQGKHVVLDFATIENYYDYVSYFYAPGSPLIASGGVFLRRGYQHIALPPSQGVQDVLIHELAHNRLSHLPLPAWLNEGIAVTMERKIGGNRSGRLDHELHRKHRDYWSPETMAAFWNGYSFHDTDGKVIGLSYSLADNLVDLLVQEFPNFMDFVAQANRKDAGQAAAEAVFDLSLNDIASAFLGPGEWTSKIVEES